MAKFHVNDKGNVGRCTAAPGSCRFGTDSEHSSSRDEARAKAEEKLSVEYSSVGSSTAKRPIDHLTNLLCLKPDPMSRDMKAPMPDDFKMPRGRNGYTTSYDEPESPPAAEPGNDFSKFVKTVETANNESLPDRELSQAAWNFNRSRIFNRETPVIDDNFKNFYNDSRIENSNLTLQGWEPENSTQDYIVKDLVSSVLSQHSMRLEIDGIKEDPFVKAYDSKNAVETVGKPNNANQKLQTVSDFSSGVISGLIDSTERAKKRSFPSEDTESGRKKQLRKFFKEEAALYEIAYQEDNSDFNDGRAWFMNECLEEDN